MKPQITPNQALEILYKVARQAVVNADTHDAMNMAADVLAEFISPKNKPVVKEEVISETPKTEANTLEENGAAI